MKAWVLSVSVHKTVVLFKVGESHTGFTCRLSVCHGLLVATTTQCVHRGPASTVIIQARGRTDTSVRRPAATL